MAKKESKPATLEALVLRDCGFGKVGEVVTLPLADIEAGAEHGMLDPHPDAVRAAKAK
jgi:hypothetical protein